jgi:MFS family permease
MPGEQLPDSKAHTARTETYHDRSTALRFVVLIGILSFFADFTYEGSRSILGPFLANLQANAFIVGVVAGTAGFADFPLTAFHFTKASTVFPGAVPVFYAVAMGVSGSGSLAFGRLFDRFGFRVLIVLTIVSALFAPPVFLGGFWGALVGVALWGLEMGVHESIIPAAVAPMVAPNRRSPAYGLFTAAYGTFGFLGSAALGFLYGAALFSLIAVPVVLQLSGVPWFWRVAVLRSRGS